VSYKAQLELVYVPIDHLHEFEGNPQEQSQETFNNLVQEIETDGFDEPLQVIHAPDLGTKHYRVVSGNHRLKAAALLDYQELPCVIRDWDQLTAKIKLVRRNQLKGDLNPKKFTRLVNELAESEQLDHEVLHEMMGFTDIDEYMKYYKTEKKDGDKIAKKLANEADNQLRLVDNLSYILNRLFTDYGDTVPFSFMFFTHGSKMHLMIQMNSKLKRVVEKITAKCVEDALDINVVLPGLLDMGIEAAKFIDGPPEIDELEERAHNEEDDSELRAVSV
jgi:hypothetical protein